MKKFIKNFAEQFDETDISLFIPETKFRELEEWSSIVSLAIIAMIDEEYNVTIKGDDIRSATTIEDIYNVVKSRT